MVPTRFHNSKFMLVFVSLVALLLSAAHGSGSWQVRDAKISPFNPEMAIGEATILEPKLAGDLNSDGERECLEVSEGVVHLTDCDAKILWQSPSEWRVTEAQVGDLNHDGVDEAILLIWRPFKPWPVDQFLPFGGRIKDFHDNHGESCQIILVGWEKDDWRELWAGSALARPVEQLGVADLDGDGWQELAALENDYDATRIGGQLTVWRWLGFGFTLLDRTESRWERLTIMGDGVHHWLFTR